MTQAPDGATYRILVGAAYDDTGENALRMAVDLARHRPRVELHVAHVIPESVFASYTTNVEDRARLFATHPMNLVDFAKPFLVDTLGDVAVHVRVGDPAPVLLQLALDYDADVLVVGTHDQRGLERLVLDSVARALLEAGRYPIAIAMPPQFQGMTKTALSTPECADCVAVRKTSGGRELWCPRHAKLHVATSLKRHGDHWVPMGGLDPGLIA